MPALWINLGEILFVLNAWMRFLLEKVTRTKKHRAGVWEGGRKLTREQTERETEGKGAEAYITQKELSTRSERDGRMMYNKASQEDPPAVVTA